jgi:hypothetical protein
MNKHIKDKDYKKNIKKYEEEETSVFIYLVLFILFVLPSFLCLYTN